MRLVITDPAQRLIRILNYGRTLIRPHGRYFLNHIGDSVRIRNDNLFRLFAPQILELLQHLFRCAEIQRSLVIRVLISLSRHNNAAVYLILRI